MRKLQQLFWRKIKLRINGKWLSVLFWLHSDLQINFVEKSEYCQALQQHEIFVHFALYFGAYFGAISLKI